MPISKAQDTSPTLSTLPIPTNQYQDAVPGKPDVATSLAQSLATDTNNTVWAKPDSQDQNVPPKKRRRRQSLDGEASTNSVQETDTNPNREVSSSSATLVSPSLPRQITNSQMQAQAMWNNTWNPTSRTTSWPQLLYPFVQSLAATPPPTPSPPLQCCTPRPYIGHGLPQCQRQQVLSPSIFNQVPPRNHAHQGNQYKYPYAGSPFNTHFQYQGQPYTQANRWYGPAPNINSFGMYTGTTPTGPERPTAPDTPVSPHVYPSGSSTYQYQSVNTAMYEGRSPTDFYHMDSAGLPHSVATSIQQTMYHKEDVITGEQPQEEPPDVIKYWTDGSNTVGDRATPQPNTTSLVQPDVISTHEEDNTNIDSPRTFYNLDKQPPKATSSPVRRNGNSELSDSTTRSASPISLAGSGAPGITEDMTGSNWLNNLLSEPISYPEEEPDDNDNQILSPPL